MWLSARCADANSGLAARLRDWRAANLIIHRAGAHVARSLNVSGDAVPNQQGAYLTARRSQRLGNRLL